MLEMFSRRIVNRHRASRFIEYFAKGDNWHKMDQKRGNLGYGWIHYGLIRLCRPELVLCIGSRYGFVPAVCAMGCRDNNFGRVDFVDAGFDMSDFGGPGEHWGGVGFWKKCNPQKYFGYFGLEKHIALAVMKSKEYGELNKEKKYGYVYIDGDHSYKGVKGDFEMFWPRVVEGGFLAIHDIGSPDKDGNVYGTRKFWREVARKYKVVMQFAEDPGLGVVQKI